MNHQVRIYKSGSPVVLSYEKVASSIGEPGNGQVRIRHDAIGLNFVDTMFRDGTFDVPLPFSMGVEGAGVVESVGPDVVNFSVGDRVAYFFSFGAYSDTRLIDAEALVKLPGDISTMQAAALITKGFTAWMLLKRVHVIQPGEKVLIHGAAGGVGTLLAPWAKALGADVIATVGSSAKVMDVQKHGIEHVLSSADVDLAKKVRQITQGQGVDVVYELVGRATFGASVMALRDGGHLIHAGNASGHPVVDREALAAMSIRYDQPSTAQYVKGHDELALATSDLFDAVRRGIFGEIKAARYPLRDVVRAHEDLAARRISGSAILIP
ncbi:MAG: quinone oxidoreductase family protein [Nitrospiraceae bacterium]